MYMKQVINLLKHFALLHTNKTQKVHARLIHIINEDIYHEAWNDMKKYGY